MCKGISDHQKAGEMAQEADGDEAERASFVSAMDSCSEAGEKPDFGGAAAFVTFGAGSDDGRGRAPNLPAPARPGPAAEASDGVRVHKH